MKRKAIRNFLLIITLTVLIEIISLNTVKAIENDEKIEYSDSYKYYMSLSDEERAEVSVVPKATVLSVKSYKKAIADKPKRTNETQDIPSYYNLADNYNLKVEDQGSEGNCWAFASLNSLETYLMIHGYGEYDFSEIHLSYIESIDFYNTKGQKSNRRPNERRFFWRYYGLYN